MESDAICAAGMTYFLKEKFLDLCDAFPVAICNTCG